MTWRRAIGAGVMLAGAGTLLATATGATLLAASFVRAGESGAPVEALAGMIASAVASGALIMLLGRAIYGRWRAATPIASVTIGIARTVGLLVAVTMAGLLIFLFASGMEREDAPAAAMLALGAAGGLLLAQVGVSLRTGGRRKYLD